MPEVSNVDRLAAILRQRLAERARKPASAQARSPEAALSPTAIDALIAAGAASDQEVGRALLQAVLSDHIGPGVLNDGQFQHTVTRVLETINDDSTAASLLAKAVAALKSR